MEQECAQQLERDKKLLEAQVNIIVPLFYQLSFHHRLRTFFAIFYHSLFSFQVKDMQTRVDDAQAQVGIESDFDF